MTTSIIDFINVIRMSILCTFHAFINSCTLQYVQSILAFFKFYRKLTFLTLLSLFIDYIVIDLHLSSPIFPCPSVYFSLLPQ